MITYYLYSAAINFLMSALCCVLILLSKNKSKAAECFLIFSICVALWSGFYFLMLCSPYEPQALLLNRLVNLCALFIPLTFFHFSCQLLNQYNKFKKLIFFLYVFNLLLLPIIFTSYFVSHVAPIGPFRFWPKAGPLYIILLLEYLILISLALIQLFQAMRSSCELKEKRKLQFVFYGLLLGFAGGSTNFPFLYDINIPPVGNMMVSLYTLGVFYAVFKYQFMDVTIILKRSLIYSLLVTLLTLIFLILVLVIERLTQNYIGYNNVLTSILLSLVIATIFIPLRNLIQNIVEKLLFKGTYLQITEENLLLHNEIIKTERLKTIATLSSSLAHEIRNPLTVLQTFNEHLSQKKNDPEFFEKYQRIVGTELGRINHLVEELLSFAKPTPPRMELTNINELIQGLVSLLEQQCHRSNIQIETKLIAETTLISADPNQLKQALLNILLNAIDAMPDGGVLTIRTSLQEHLFTIEISDTGKGIKPEDLKYIFDPFFTKKDKGTGLGLSITQGIIQNHKGIIKVESTWGLGATFRIHLSMDQSL